MLMNCSILSMTVGQMPHEVLQNRRGGKLTSGFTGYCRVVADVLPCDSDTLLIRCYAGAIKLKSRLAQLMSERSLTNSQVSQKAGLDMRTISRLRDSRSLRYQCATLVKVCNSLNLNKVSDIIQLE